MDDFLHAHELFATLSPDELKRVAALSRTLDVKEGETVLRQNEPTSSLFLIEDGTVRVVDRNRAEESVLAVLGSGDAFGELGLLDAQPPSASVVAEEPCRLYRIDREALLALMHEDQLLANKILWALARGMARRLRETDQSLAHARQMVNLGARGI